MPAGWSGAAYSNASTAPGRAVRHRLTAEGRAALDAGSGVFDEVLAQSFGALSAEERTTLLELLVKAEASS